MLTRLFGQVILCTKEVSVGARKNAFTLLVEMGHAFLRFGSSQEGEAGINGRTPCLQTRRPLKPLVLRKGWRELLFWLWL